MSGSSILFSFSLSGIFSWGDGIDVAETLPRFSLSLVFTGLSDDADAAPAAFTDDADAPPDADALNDDAMDATLDRPLALPSDGAGPLLAPPSLAGGSGGLASEPSAASLASPSWRSQGVSAGGGSACAG